ncbi:MAG TPA: ribosome maturation factor RimP [Acidimicrobiales bacterium]|nr:ribosome maturation factor RimP [Acidimicrobiales bacterium]
MNGTGDELTRVLSQLCADFAIELDDVELDSGVLRVTVERADGLDLDRLAEVSRAVSALLDAREDLAPAARYELEVSTPGLERRLRRPGQFRRAVGSTVAVRTVPGTAGERRLEGVLVAADDETFEVAAATGGSRRLIYREVERAHTVFDWRRALAERRGAGTEETGAGTDGSDEGERPGHAHRSSSREEAGRAGGRASRRPDATKERATTS